MDKPTVMETTYYDFDDIKCISEGISDLVITILNFCDNEYYSQTQYTNISYLLRLKALFDEFLINGSRDYRIEIRTIKK